MKKEFITITIILMSNFVFAQCNGRYQSEIFSSVSSTTVNYSDIYTDGEHEMDIYSANGDTTLNRPIILYMHGGSFYGGDKTTTDCIDFCTSMAKRGYVAVSLNYRLSNIISFITSQEEQYRTVLKAVADAKAAIRFFRKDHNENGNVYRIDPNTIFVGGYSAGAVIAVHLAYIDNITDLPTSPLNVQNLVAAIGGDLEGDAGNIGYSSDIQGVISFAGGINTISWIDNNDEPLVSIQGTDDLTVNYNCGPGINNPLVLTLCGAGEMHPQADNVGLLNDKLIFNGTGHDWAAYGNTDSKFIQAVNFSTDFIYPLLPCNNISSISEVNTKAKKLISITDILGRNTQPNIQSILLYLYDDGSVEKRMLKN